jgi:hypothetical protein
MVETVQPEGRVAEAETVPVGLGVPVGLPVASVTGQTVVLTAMTEVTVRAGQLVTVAGQDVMVEVMVV